MALYLDPQTTRQATQDACVPGPVQAVEPALAPRPGEQDRRLFELVRYGWHASHGGCTAAPLSSVARGESSVDAGAAR